MMAMLKAGKARVDEEDKKKEEAQKSGAVPGKVAMKGIIANKINPSLLAHAAQHSDAETMRSVGGRNTMLNMLAHGALDHATKMKKLQQERAAKYARFTPAFFRLLRRDVDFNAYPQELKKYAVPWTDYTLKLKHLNYASERQLRDESKAKDLEAQESALNAAIGG